MNLLRDLLVKLYNLIGILIKLFGGEDKRPGSPVLLYGCPNSKKVEKLNLKRAK